MKAMKKSKNVNLDSIVYKLKTWIQPFEKTVVILRSCKADDECNYYLHDGNDCYQWETCVLGAQQTGGLYQEQAMCSNYRQLFHVLEKGNFGKKSWYER